MFGHFKQVQVTLTKVALALNPVPDELELRGRLDNKDGTHGPGKEGMKAVY